MEELKNNLEDNSRIVETLNSENSENLFKEDLRIIFLTFTTPKEAYNAVRKYIIDTFVKDGDLSEDNSIWEFISQTREKVTETFPDDPTVLNKFNYLLTNLNTAFDYDKAGLDKKNENWQ